MKVEAIAEARIRLRRARDAVAQLQRLDFNFDRQEDAWWSFLLAADQVYEKLRIGSIDCTKSRPWFGRREHLRRKDPLLRYIHQARNSDQHGLATATARTEIDLVAVYGCKVVKDAAGNITVKATVGVPMKIQAVPPAIKLVTVIDEKHHDSFDPPVSHLGKAITDPSPAGVATLALAYLTSLVDEAAGRVA